MLVAVYSGSAIDVVEMTNLETLTSCVVNVKLDFPRREHTADGDHGLWWRSCLAATTWSQQSIWTMGNY